MDQFKVLDAIRANGPVTVREICAIIGYDNIYNVNTKISRLCHKGLVEKCGIAPGRCGHTANLYVVTPEARGRVVGMPSRYDRYLNDTDRAVYRFISSNRSTTDQVLAGLSGYDRAEVRESIRRLRRTEYIRSSGCDSHSRTIWEVV